MAGRGVAYGTRGRFVAGLAVLAVLAGLGQPSHANADVVADAICAPPRDVTFGNWGTSDGGAAGNQRIAQTFVARNSGGLVIARIDVRKGPDIYGDPAHGDYYVQVLPVDPTTGRPINTLLASTIVLDSTVPEGDSIITAAFANPAILRRGLEYALVLTRPGAEQLAYGVRNYDRCFGAIYVSNTQSGEFFGGGFQDMVFETYVDTSLAPPPDAGPPVTTITARPKEKTRKRTAIFKFTSSDPGSTFVCSLDGASEEACASPVKHRVGRGRHEFQVQAIDPTGRADPTPAQHDWRVKRSK
jgi:hypothetical protein